MALSRQAYRGHTASATAISAVLREGAAPKDEQIVAAARQHHALSQVLRNLRDFAATWPLLGRQT